ncbi:MAG TPA: prenyltransferase/squalene oxidase repeat-containing protein [Bryobacteraceae bacterium]|nr:prenyltransferase/squalene oxidase repeat-containing protein [Bryobacteraceae bacterium]
MTRRSLMALFASTAIGAAAWPGRFRRRIFGYLEEHRRPEGAYGWSSDVQAQLTPTFGAVGCYRILGAKIPDAPRVAAFVRDHYPAPEPRRIDRPMWRLDFEQVQSLLWLDESIESFRKPASTWTAPSVLTPRYELHRQPVLQNQAMAVHIRYLLKLSPSGADGAWREYFLARLRPDGTFNNTPAADGSGGHLMNTRWGLLAAEHLGLKLPPAPGLAEWVRSCQMDSGGFTWAPNAKLGAVDDLAYTWCALQILAQLEAKPADAKKCAAWIESLQTSEGGFQDRPDGEPNPLATYYALSCMRLLNHVPNGGVTPAPRARRIAVPAEMGVYAIQLEAPGVGSTIEAVSLAKSLGIHIWAAKNSPAGWIDDARRIAEEQKVPVTFAFGDEEYGTYYGVAGLGCYSHLVDVHAPHGADFGKPVEKKNHPYTYEEFRDTRIEALHRGRGRLVWQCNDNEEISRVLLDEAVRTGSYAAIASFHFGIQDFAHTYPFLHRWYGRIPFVGLLDAHTAESWWWGDQLGGQKTLFLAKEPSWDGWLQALKNNWVVSVRHDAATRWKTHMTGGQPHVRESVMRHEAEWRWWDKLGQPARRPGASLVLLRPGMPFEAGAPAVNAQRDLALRLRLWQDNSQQGKPAEPRAELVAMKVDGKEVSPELRASAADRYFLLPLRRSPGEHRAEAEVRLLASRQIKTYSVSWHD